MRPGAKRGGAPMKWQPTGRTNPAGSPVTQQENAFEDSAVRDKAQRVREGEQSSPVSLGTPSSATTARPQYYQSVEGLDALTNIFYNTQTDDLYVVEEAVFPSKPIDEIVSKIHALAKQYHN